MSDDPKELLSALRAADLKAARDDFFEFVHEIKPDFSANFHHEIICDRLTRLAHEQGQRLIITVPPQYGKSELISRLFPAWLMGQTKGKAKIIAASYAAELSNGFNRECQAVMASGTYRAIFPEVKISPEVRAKRTEKEVHTSERGYLYTTGIGGATTGKSANPLFIVDDPIKDMQDAMNPEYRKKMVEWFNAVAMTRCSLNANIIVMHTRWHQDDLAGYLIDQSENVEGASKWEVMNFPALSDPDDKELRMHPDDPRKEKGLPLWANWKGDAKFLGRLKIDLGSAIFNALYQGKPNSDGGNMVNPSWFRTYHTMPDRFDQLIISLDANFKESEKSDPVSIQVWGRIGIEKYIVDQLLGRWGINKTIDMLIEMIIKYPSASAKVIEAKANGEAIIETIQLEVPGVIPVYPKDSKEVRLQAVSPQIEAGNVWIPDEKIARFDVAGFKREIGLFPKGKNDDQVDAMTQALEYLSKGENHYLRKLLGRESRDERGRKYPPGGIRETGTEGGQQNSNNAQSNGESDSPSRRLGEQADKLRRRWER